MTYHEDSRQYFRRTGLGLLLVLVVLAAHPFAANAQARKPAAKASTSGRRPLTQADVQRLWTSKSDSLLSNEIRSRGLGFTPSGYWLEVELPKATGVPRSEMAESASALRRLIPPAPDVDLVAKEAPELLASLKAAAQKRSDGDLALLIDPSLMANKASVYDLFDTANFRASSLGKPALDEHGDVGMPFFKLDTSNVEKLYYVLFSKPKGRLIVEDLITGTDVAALYLHDQETLAKSKLDTMFRALNDGDQTGLKELCAPGLFEAIQEWGGEKHPGDRLSQGHSFSQVTTQTSVPLDQKSIRVVTKVSYPLKTNGNLIFYIDFERVGNDLKVVRLRDEQNRVIVFDPNVDNYLNRRYGLPDGKPIDVGDVAMTENVIFLSSSVLRRRAVSALQYHDRQAIADIARMYIEQNPTSGDGYGLRAAAELLQHKSEEALKDGLLALEKNGTVYFLVERHSLGNPRPFGLAVLGISKSKIDYVPGTGTGSPETIDLQSLKVSFEKAIPFLRQPRPFSKFEFKGTDGKGKTYNFADYGTICPSDTTQPRASDLIQEIGGGACGFAPTGSKLEQAQGLPLLTPQAWREDLATVIQVVNTAKSSRK